MTLPNKKMAALVRFSAEEDEILIEFVRTHAILFDMSDAEFKNSMKKDLTWAEAGKLINKDGSQCKKRWKSIRDHYRKEKKGENNISGSVVKKKRAVYWDRLRFLSDVDNENNSIPDVLDAVTEEPSTSTAVTGLAKLAERGNASSNSAYLNGPAAPLVTKEATPLPEGRGSEGTTFRQPASKKRQHNSTFQLRRFLNDLANSSMSQNNDDIDLFFKAMAATVKKFRPNLATQTKIKVFKVVTDMELLNQRSPALNITELTNMANENLPLYSSSSSSSQSGHNDEPN